MFYEGELKADKTLQKRTPPGRNMEKFWLKGTSCPVVFCNVVGKEEEYKVHKKVDRGRVDPHSKCNFQEAEKVVSPCLYQV